MTSSSYYGTNGGRRRGGDDDNDDDDAPLKQSLLPPPSNNGTTGTTSTTKKVITMIRKEQLDAEEAETANIAYFDHGAKRALSGHPSTDPLEAAVALPTAVAAKKPPPRLVDIARRINMMRQVSTTRRKLAEEENQNQHQHHARMKSQAAQDLLRTMQNSNNGGRTNNHNNHHNNRDHHLYQSVGLYESDEETETEAEATVKTTNETLPLQSSSSQYGSLVVQEVAETRRQQQKYKQSKQSKLERFQNCLFCDCLHCLHPMKVLRTILCSYFVWVAIPFFTLAAILFYVAGNPMVPWQWTNDENTSSISWWCNFAGRQVVTLELARICQYLIFACGLNNRNIAHWLGPHLTMIAIQAQGWPFIITAWGFINVLLLHGTGPFHQNWLYWTGLKLYNQQQQQHSSSSISILSSTLYIRLLLSMMFAGIAVTTKRTIVAIRFGKRLLSEFKPRMEALLADIVLLHEIAVLSDQVDSVSEVVDKTPHMSNIMKKTVAAAATSNKTSITTTTATTTTTTTTPMHEDIAWTDVQESHSNADDNQNPIMSEDTKNDTTTMTAAAAASAAHSSPNRNAKEQNLRKTSSGSLAIKDLLDQWEDPLDDLHKRNREVTIEDVLKFKRALGYMDESHPFGDSYGLARDRDEAISSAHNVFWKLMKFDNDASAINFDVLAMIANDHNGIPNHAKLQALRKLFRPDAHNELPLLAFVQSCDTVYKRLRYFRASVSNSSAIDKVLENMVNIIFWFMLALILLSIMDFDPWTLLVSITSLLVSVSFALGSSVSNYMEGLLLIAARRPYDLGDRIMIVGSEAQDRPPPTESYFVEDITLLSTTVRFARTNEVSTINNFSISKSRIINLQRSANAIVYLEMQFNMDALKNDKYLQFREIMEQYVSDHPRIWDCLVFMRHDEFDPDWEKIIFRFAFRHRNSWQYAARILMHRGDLVRFMYETGMQMKLHWETPIPRRTILDGGIIENNEIRPRKSNSQLPLFSSDLLPNAAAD